MTAIFDSFCQNAGLQAWRFIFEAFFVKKIRFFARFALTNAIVVRIINSYYEFYKGSILSWHLRTNIF